jgi:hypothetical protein
MNVSHPPITSAFFFSLVFLVAIFKILEVAKYVDVLVYEGTTK